MTEKEALNQAMKLCSRKEYSSGEMLQKLIDWELEEPTARKLVDKLIEEKFIDNARYSRAFVNDKLKFSGWGKAKISFMLKQKGVEGAIINETIDNIEPEFYEDILFTELMKKSKGLKSESDYEFKGKLVQFASGRGFEYDLATRIAERILALARKPKM